MDFDTLADLKNRLTDSEYVKYLVQNYPLLFEEYAKTKKTNTTLSALLIICGAMSLMLIFVITLYYRRKIMSIRKKCNKMVSMVKGDVKL